MKISSAPELPKSIARAKAKNYLILNLLACPGLGTVLAGRRVGYPQLAAAVAGFGLIFGWFVWFFATIFTRFDYPESGHWNWSVLVCGSLLFGGAWFWSLFSSLAILKEAGVR
ncbi:MAG: hypothetical protein ACYDH9_17610 [Limisphaerales bacterium]